MKKIKLLPIIILLSALSCNNDEEKARGKLESAKNFISEGNYNQARLQLDSINLLYPNAIAVRQESQVLSWEIESKELQRSLSYMDSILLINSQKSNKLKEALFFEKNAEYQSVGLYMDKNQTLEKTMGTTCLRFYVNENGIMTVVGVISGQGRGNFSGIRAQTPDGIYGETPELARGDSNNYNGELSQTLNFIRGNDNGFIEFLYTYKEEPLKISFTGTAKPSFHTFSQAEKNALEKVYSLMDALSEVNQLDKEKKLVMKKIEFTRRAIEKAKLNKL